jgi:hypothetical protein
VTMCNVSNADAVTLAHRVADVVLGSRFTEPAPAPMRAAGAQQQALAPGTLSDAALAAFAGRFYSPELDATYDMSANDHRLVLKRPRAPADTLRALDDHTFRGAGLTIKFVGSNAFMVDNGRARGLEFSRAN